MRAQHRRNFTFFDASVELIFSIECDLPVGAWVDCGMILQNIMFTTRGSGFELCPQQAFAPYHETIRDPLDLPDNRMVICAMAMTETSDPANRFHNEREPQDQFATFHN
ncbi:nitroreductase family protein [Salipiger sp. 1_MG-2023]|uniref:nitroreductase family protein n=1 Tax=Salipiger sp. 1_MG-2023 TaxID=3062665 RepID=UPI0026E21CA5|nr:nitroreductase family protein [Salipiger sp. 1_MG-2023]MDO6588172.1 nitroreductase family protein [Salipiger sp. 1_MG-2023]